ncbi:MAG: HAD-IIIA family hydrolase [Prevotellaceae bacterium]|jgi:3-deoxy-D-manno-octulosonate 8-phosphate phosphatase (KDO 8-P phosphatase)|nr:HAD-IIIA family hydrolase [Prevotellaceae bacterium]
MIKHLIIDVDGTLTDGGVYYDSHGNELKKFNTKDGTGFFIAKAVGIRLIVLTSRECEATLRRMTELKTDIVCQNVKDKAAWLRNYMAESNLPKSEIGYIGDDINDLPPMRLCGFVGCPADACKEVKAIANYVSSVNGGYGAVRDCIEYLLAESDTWSKYAEQVYGNIGI